MKKYFSDRLACDLLTAQFFDYFMSLNKVQALLRFTKTLRPDFGYAWLQAYKISRVETLIGFSTLLEAIGEVRLREFYSEQTYRNRKRLITEVASSVDNPFTGLKL
ncbi:hypothetical protein [Alicyclobacillus dauci]|uniref:Uncharacterized protein n=1 Tax=Alicyclobacillus dauci TaxID=1475485 RepID=A0ABY6Z2F4_9BACL|nr:hypothetical protein [Alicyclobacillus dauci]WAH36371.1 hypothetical protein NZD86_19415 [Alicyclobacillus dauci]